MGVMGPIKVVWSGGNVGHLSVLVHPTDNEAKACSVYNSLGLELFLLILLKSILHVSVLAAVSKWLRTLILSALNHFSSHSYGFEPSPGHM